MNFANCISLCFFFLAIFTNIAVSTIPLTYICLESGKFTSNSRYDKNLRTLFNQLTVKVPPSGFGLSSVGKNQDAAHGLALCRGDVTNAACKSCVNTAAASIQLQCPNQKGAIIWYDNCMLKYSNSNFFGEIDSAAKFYFASWQNVSDNEPFNENTDKFFSQLSNEASQSPKLFAASEMSLGGSETLYGLVQCTRDLSDVQCKKCLDDAISELPICCDGRQGGRIVEGSCNFRYDLYPSFST